jgi:hypothetical protein
MSKKLLTTREVKARTGFSLVRIRTLIRKGKLKGENLSAGARPYFMVPEEAVDELLRGNVPPPPIETGAVEKAKRCKRIDTGVERIFG